MWGTQACGSRGPNPAEIMDEARALLEQLMGRERDIPVDKRVNRQRKVWDDDICKPYLCGKFPAVVVVVVSVWGVVLGVGGVDCLGGCCR